MKKLSTTSKAFLIALSLTMVATSVTPRRSEAFVGMFYPLATVAIVGLYTFVGGAALGLAARPFEPKTDDDCKGFCKIFADIDGTVIVLGLVALDETNHGPLTLAPIINAKQIQAVGLTENEVREYNGSIDDFNALSQTITAEAQAMQPAMTFEQSVQFAKSRWNENQNLFSADALSGAAKVMHLVFDKKVKAPRNHRSFVCI